MRIFLEFDQEGMEATKVLEGASLNWLTDKFLVLDSLFSSLCSLKDPREFLSLMRRESTSAKLGMYVLSTSGRQGFKSTLSSKKSLVTAVTSFLSDCIFFTLI